MYQSVRDFAEVFPEDRSAGFFLSARDQWNSNHLIPRAATRSTSTVQISSNQISNYQNNYKNFLTKDHKPSILPCGAPVFICQKVRMDRSGCALPTNEKEHEEILRQYWNCLRRSRCIAKFVKSELWIPKNYRRLLKSKTKHTQKGNKVRLGRKGREPFQLIKQSVQMHQFLALPEGSEDFVVYCDASHKGLGAVLMQRENVIAYAS
ncbi:putative reverse transcriptase domain-containing protein [Tanacetum coccineum]